VGSLELVVILLIGLGICGVLFGEGRHRRRRGNALVVTPGNWDLAIYEPHHYRLVGDLDFFNPVPNLEVMIPELRAELKLLSKESLAAVKHTITVTPRHPDVGPRGDGYWFAYILKSRKHTQVEIVIDIEGEDLRALQTAWVQVHYTSYGPKGYLPRTYHEVVPLRFPDPDQPKRWRPVDQGDVLPIFTHLLTQLDDPVAIVRRYVLPQAQPGDVVTIGETPIAIMQGRWHHPTTVQPGWLAQRLCYFFLPTSSLATACGLQTLIDISGAWRVLGAFLVGAIAKVFGKPGVFYQLAGEQARLIDDVTGTLPPYDQFIVLGPHDPQRVVDQIQAETGLAAAIVDVNDLKRVKVLAATSGVSLQFLATALRANPAGNADEQTPIVLIRPAAPAEATRTDQLD
jgi:hypothetical protein